MKTIQDNIQCSGIKVAMRDDHGNEVGRAFLYIMHNDLRAQPFGLMEDVYIAEKIRGQGLGTSLVQKIIVLAKEKGCYKLIATSRYSREKVHQLYTDLGFQDYGKEFRIDL
ncbi:MAG: GNAT family N-acetyltransferase [Candidatus Tagabacteria bacterium CG09_land_8_20_14_0_10_41_14]|uniref:GNAT family N-acetyltransferase n=2 Tax=Candidatus Tagaibacteriota TaxID=1817918 RepID=A0A2H0WL38_9BACT|nr:MAG: GNAT family N-acetyltransferase [Candidatus Tagabacteria bacterium CG09_land_8_20_14_0_10_41_14]PJE72793.1 MAG: GNAT family N-acetyltransferase [Candidatus Tagabacteria bacterium CG10_big_fil_rev_8_21_14_0_10_40_13]